MSNSMFGSLNIDTTFLVVFLKLSGYQECYARAKKSCFVHGAARFEQYAIDSNFNGRYQGSSNRETLV